MKKLAELNMEFVVIDDTLREERIARDLKRADRSLIPVNLVYPANYPEEPVILLEGLISPNDALKALGRMEEIENSMWASRLTINQ